MEQHTIEQHETPTEAIVKTLKEATRSLETEINIIREYASKTRLELTDLRAVMMDARDQVTMLKDIRSKVEEIHNKVALVEEEEMF